MRSGGWITDMPLTWRVTCCRGKCDVIVDAVENCRGFWWLFEKPDLLFGKDGVLCGGCLLVWLAAIVDGEDE
jgi:hypothetical protein